MTQELSEIYLQHLDDVLGRVQQHCADLNANATYENLKVLDKGHVFAPKLTRPITADEFESGKNIYSWVSKIAAKVRPQIQARISSGRTLTYEEYEGFFRQAFHEAVAEYASTTPPTEKQQTEALFIRTYQEPFVPTPTEAAQKVFPETTDVPAFVVLLNEGLQTCLGTARFTTVFGRALWLKEYHLENKIRPGIA